MVLLMAFLRGSTDGLGVLQHVHVSSSAYYFVILCMRGDAGRPSFASSNFIMHERIPLGRIRVLPSSPRAQSTARVVRLPEIDVRVVYIHMGGGQLAYAECCNMSGSDCCETRRRTFFPGLYSFAAKMACTFPWISLKHRGKESVV